MMQGDSQSQTRSQERGEFGKGSFYNGRREDVLDLPEVPLALPFPSILVLTCTCTRSHACRGTHTQGTLPGLLCPGGSGGSAPKGPCPRAPGSPTAQALDVVMWAFQETSLSFYPF